ncbi:MAG: hypothetical protein LH619_05870 [Chitinophagaceae bacterium]|nr:hypothetical protein [Chitinophagaceae bacterium]
MGKLLLLIITILFMGCATKEEWTKDALVNKCLGDFTKRNEKEKKFSTLQIGLLCDCIAEKMTTKYKTAKEADKDEAGGRQIGQDCATEVMSK